MIDIKDKTKCCGCSSCVNTCPNNAISFNIDNNGFKYPIVDIGACINCGLCEKVCPYNSEYVKKDVYEKSIAYGGWNTDDVVRKNSTSGGIFSAISKFILENNGVICGAIYNEKLEVVHEIVDNIKDLEKIYGSKYVQSDMKDNYKKIREYLNNGRLVLFSGTPCQVEGLNSFLGNEFENLYTCDIVCHGVPSPKVFKKYKEELEERHNSEIININFRDKITRVAKL